VNKSPQVYWVDKLTWVSVFRLAVLILVTRRASSQSVRYLSSSVTGIRMIGLLAIISRGIGTRLDRRAQGYDLYDLRSCGEKRSTFEIDGQVDDLQERVGKAVVGNIDVDQLVATRLKRQYDKKKVRLFLVESIGNEIYDAALSLIVMHRLALCAVQESNGPQTILIGRSVFHRYIVSEYKISDGVRVQSYAGFGEHRLLLRSAASFAIELLAALFSLAIRFPGRGRTTRTNKGSSRPRIAVQYTQGADLDRLSDLFWFPVSGLSGNQVLVYFNRKRFPISEAAVRQLDGLGLNWMSVSDWSPRGGSAGYLRDLLKVCHRSIRLALLAPFVRLYPGGWQWRAALNLERRVSYWSAFLRDNGVAAHLHHVANTPTAIPMVFAAENAGAIDFGYQWSASEFARRIRSRTSASHVYFAWGDVFVSLMRDNGLLPDVYLVGGDVFGQFGIRTTGHSLQTRTRLLDSGCEYVICLFDGGFHIGIHQTPKLMTDFYETVLQWALDDRKLGFSIKPKGSGYEGLPGVKPLIDELISRGQCIVEDPGVTSFEAALAADIVVGVGINTAVIEAALAGVPAVHFDLPEMVSVYPGMEHGAGRFVFNNAAELFAAVETHRESGGKTAVGDHGEWLKSVDPFQDGGAAQRMGTYLRWYLESIEAGQSSTQAVAEATERYSREVGPQYVFHSQAPNPQ